MSLSIPYNEIQFWGFFLKDKQGETSIHTDPEGIKMCQVKLGII